MAKATQQQKAHRLNWVRAWLRRYPAPRVRQELIQQYAHSPRQAYRYLQQAQQLQRPVSIEATKIAFTVKLPQPLVTELRRYVAGTSLNLSQTVSQALSTLLAPRRRRG